MKIPPHKLESVYNAVAVFTLPKTYIDVVNLFLNCFINLYSADSKTSLFMLLLAMIQWQQSMLCQMLLSDIVKL